MTYSPVVKIASDPIDIVGDVHGHLEPLKALIERLGYDERGVHPKGRRLVFVGDLCDRGPDSPGVFDLAMRAVEEGGAVALLGNHELALIDTDESERQKAGNAWFFGDKAKCQKDEKDFGSFERVKPGQRDRILEFCDSMPLAVVHPKVQIVHACWDPESLAFVSGLDAGSNREIVAACNARAMEKLEEAGFRERFPKAKQALEEKRRSRDWEPDKGVTVEEQMLIDDLVAGEQIEQRENPIRVLTSGHEWPAGRARWLGKKWRFLDRVPWWAETALEKPTVFGHYWRQWVHLPEGPYDEHAALFGAARAEEWLGPNRLAMCVDYRWPTNPRCPTLAAYQPDRQELVFWAAEEEPLVSRWGRG